MAAIEIRMEQCFVCQIWQDYLAMTYDPLDNVWYCEDHAPFIDMDKHYLAYPIYKKL